MTYPSKPYISKTRKRTKWGKGQGRWDKDNDTITRQEHDLICIQLKPHHALTAEVLFDTGVRVSEFVNTVCPGDIDQEFEGQPILWVETLKQDKGNYRPVPLSIPTLKVLIQYIKMGKIPNNKPITPGESTTSAAESFRKAMKRAAVNAGLVSSVVVSVLKEKGEKVFHPHQYRHAKATRLIAAGVPDAVIMEVMGWKTHEMILRYHSPELKDVVAAGHADWEPKPL